MTFLIAVVAAASFWSMLILVYVHRRGGIWHLGGSRGVVLGEQCSARTNQLFQFSIPSLEVVQVAHDCLPVVHARWERCLRVDLQKDGLRESPDVASSKADSLKLVCLVSISKLAMYSSVVMPG